MLRATSPTRFHQHHRSTPTPSRVLSVMVLALATALTPLGTLLTASPAAAAPVANPPVLTYYAGTGTGGNASASGTPALSSKLNYPRHLAATAGGDVYLADAQNHRIEKVATDGTMTYVAGTGTAGNSTTSAVATTQPLRSPWGVAVDAAGNIYIADTGNNAIRRVDATTQVMTRIAGSPTGASGASTSGQAVNALLNEPSALAIGSDGSVYISETSNHRVSKIDPSGAFSVIAGTGTQAVTVPPAGPATSRAMNQPNGLVVDASGNVYVADTFHHRIEKITPAGAMTIVAGTGFAASSPAVAGPAATTQLYAPYSVALDGAGNLLIADTRSRQIERVSPAGDLTVIAGTGVRGTAQNGAAATATPLGTAFGLAVGPGGLIYVTDTDVQRILKLTPPPGTVPAVTSSAPTAQAIAGQPYSFTPTATGTPSRTWAISAGSLPAGLSLDPATGTISGTPPAAAAAVTSTFTLKVATSAGYDLQPASITVVVPPSAPQSLTASADDTAVDLTWVAPLSDGGTPITGYTATATPGGATCTSAGALGCSITGLTNGTSYTVSVTATNTAGTGAPSAASAPFTPAALVLPTQLITSNAPSSIVLASRTWALRSTSTATGAGGLPGNAGVLSATSTTPSICTVAPAPAPTSAPTPAPGTSAGTAIVTAAAAGTCFVDVLAAATSTHAATTLHVSMQILANASTGLPGGITRLGGPDPVHTSDDGADAAFPTPGPGTSYDVVLASSEKFVDSLAGARLAGQVGGPLLLTPAATLAPETAAQIQRLVKAGGTIYLLGGPQALSVAVERESAAVVPGARVVRLGGADRYETAVMVADRITAVAGPAGQGAPIYLVTGRGFVDGVSVAASAQRSGGVVLLTDDYIIPAVTASYLRAHDPQDTRAVAVGGQPQRAVTEAGLSGAATRAISGPDRYATAAQLATGYASTGPVTIIGLAGGSSWADALTGAAAMASLGGPLLLTPTGTSTLAPPSADALDTLRPQRVVIFGGTGAVTAAAAGEVAQHLGT